MNKRRKQSAEWRKVKCLALVLLFALCVFAQWRNDQAEAQYNQDLKTIYRQVSP